tara:strand:- start:978 stop:1307 length:330 start_codon:yes stop_codon:yes gene_type:complete
MSNLEEKATMTDSVKIEKNSEEQKPAPTFTYADYDAGTQKEWLTASLSADAVLIINHLQNLQNKLTSLNLEAGDLNSAIQANKQRLTALLPDDELAIITELEQQDSTAH